ncbi:MAG: hypothetical protein FPO08_00370 [Geobacter sp.]|nr:MAG: hypothetical protein FPO08_00370 [Geobacter sp.]
MALDKNFTKTYTINGFEIEVQIAPCCWMYNSPFQLCATLKATGQNGNLFVHNTGKDLSFEDATEADVDRMVQELVFIAQPCSCGNPRMLVKGNTTNRGDLCEKCFIDKLNTELEKDREKEKKRVAKVDAQKAIEGFTHKMIAWIHPKAGGSDYMVDVYFMGEPKEEDILRQLKGSAVKNDYRIEILPQPTEEEKAAYHAALLEKAGLPADTIGRTVEFSGKKYTVMGVDPKKPKTGVHLRDEKGASYSCPIATLKARLAR